MGTTTARPHTWWKPTADTLAAYLTFDETRRMLASSSVLAPEDWQRGARTTLGERLGKVMVGTLRAGYSMATLGLSEVMFRLARPGRPAGNEDIPTLDLVVGPTDAAVLVVDGAVTSILTAQRLATHDFWERLGRTLGQGPHLEVVMLDLAPVSLTVPLRIAIGDEEVAAQVDADVAFGLEGADRALHLLARTDDAVAGPALNEPSDAPRDRASFVTAGALAERVQRRLEGRASHMQFAREGLRALCDDSERLRAAEIELSGFLTEELGPFGIAVQRCRLLLARTEDQQLAIDRRRGELEQERKAMLAEAQRLDERRRAELEAERRRIEHERQRAETEDEAGLAELKEGNRLALARMVMLDDQDLALIEREGFAERREGERAQELLDFRQEQLILRERRARELEDELAGARSELETGRINMELEREKLEIARLAQDQSLANLSRLKEIEREDDLLRERARAEAERERLAAAKDLTPEQMMAALADRDPEIARALAAKFGSEAEFARKSAEEQRALMREMQTQMTRVMEKGLDSSGAVAGGLVGAVRSGVERAPVVIDNRGEPASSGSQPPHAGKCSACGEPVEAGWRVCPYCGDKLARA